MDEKKRKLKLKISNRFKKKPSGRMELKLKDGSILGIEYMFGGKFGLRKKKGKTISIITFLADLDKLIDLIYNEKAKVEEEKFRSENKIYSKLKGIGRK